LYFLYGIQVQDSFNSAKARMAAKTGFEEGFLEESY
jgi:hypothetical protein